MASHRLVSPAVVIMVPVPANSHIASNAYLDLVVPPARAVPQSHPDVLATIGTLLGLNPVDVRTARVLEIGCGAGGNLIPMAESLPDAQFVGIDTSARQIQAAESAVAALRLKNVSFRLQSVADFDQPGPFDFILCQNVYPLATDAVRERILFLCAARLSTRGVAYISHFVDPGARVPCVLREMLVRQTTPIGDVPAKLKRARETLDFLASVAPLEGGPPLGPLGNVFGGAWGYQLKSVADQIRALPDAALLREYLGEPWHVAPFSRFMEAARAAGLQYLGDAAPDMMSTAAHGKQTDEGLSRVATDWAEAEDLLDIVRNRAVRHSLLVREDVRLQRPIDPWQVKSLFAGTSTEPVPETDDASAARSTNPGAETFAHPKGSTVEVSDPLLRAAMRAMSDAWPARLGFSDLLKATWSRMGLAGGGAAPDNAVERKLCALLLQGYFTGLVELSVRPAAYATTLTHRPTVRALARWQAERDDTVTTLRHQNLKLNRTARALVRWVDGTRTREQILAEIERSIVEGARAIGGKVELTPADRGQLSRNLEMDLKRFVAEGLMAG